MTEQEYTEVSDLARIRNMQSILREIIPDCGDVIGKDAYQTIGQILYDWESRLTIKIEIVAELTGGSQMKEQCSCRKVDYIPIRNEDGSYTEQWMCMECKSVFIRNKSAMCEADTHSPLAEVRAFINDNFCFYDEKDIKKENCFEAGYNSALRDVLTRLYKYFD